jgi:hypothetical protein
MNESGFTVVEVLSDENAVLVRPWSPSFQNSPDSYPLYKINLSDLTTDTSVTEQIAQRMYSIVTQILKNESTSTGTSTLKSALTSIIGSTVTYDISSSVFTPIVGAINDVQTTTSSGPDFITYPLSTLGYNSFTPAVSTSIFTITTAYTVIPVEALTYSEELSAYTTTTQYLLTGNIDTYNQTTGSVLSTTTFTLTANEELLINLTQFGTIDFIV